MQDMRYSFLIVILSFFSVLGVISMQPIVPMEAIILDIRLSDMISTETKILSLKKMCINVLAKTIKDGDLDTLISPKAMNQFVLLSDELNRMITANNFCHKFEHAYFYQPSSNELNKKSFDYQV